MNIEEEIKAIKRKIYDSGNGARMSIDRPSPDRYSKKELEE